ncbi:MAG: TraB/GumN family protein [Crocinitomicaceae bacterium]|nr:MAG: TraB/GumN family protein [Crocinitomicaceae bacterium]
MNRLMAYSTLALVAVSFGLFSFLLPAEDKGNPTTSLLWKIEKTGIKHPSYLFGTMHLIEKEYFYFPETLEKIVKKSDLLVMEIAGVSNQAEAMKYVVLNEGSFFDYFSKEQTDTILTWAKAKMGLDESTFRTTFSKFKPFIVIQTATQLQFMGKTESYELTFEKLATKYQLKMAGLETIADQMGIFDNLTKSQQAEMVMAGIRDEQKTNEMTRKMQQMYARQRIDSLYSFIHAEGGVLAEEQNAFLDQRNRNWIPQIKEMVANGKAFIAVGAGHLGGENGVIRLLEKEGYKLTPVRF